MTKDSQAISMLFLGDYAVRAPQKYCIGATLRQEIQNADIIGLNFEGSVEGTEIISPTKKTIPQSLNSAKWCEENGINLFSFANNHIMDFGEDGLKKTISTFDKNSSIIGIGTYEDAFTPKIFNIKGKKIGFLAATSADFSSFKTEWDDKNKIGAPWFRSEKFTLAIIDSVKICDYLFIIAHGGVEHFELPIPEIRDLYRFWIKLGVSGVIASHPHVPQGVENYQGVPIFYSLGNFIFEGSKNTHTLPKNWTNSIAAVINIDMEQVTFSYLPLSLSDGVVDVNLSKDYVDYMDKLCRTLEDDNLYKKLIDEQISIFADKFHQYLLSGLNAVIIEKNASCLKSILRALIKGKKNDKTVLHQLREDSTINTLIRDLKYKSRSYL